MDDSSKTPKSFLDLVDEYIKRRPVSGAVRANKEKMYSELFKESDVLRDLLSKSASEAEKNQSVLDDIFKRAADIYKQKQGQAASLLGESENIVRDSPLAKLHAEDIVKQQAKSPSLGYLSEVERTAVPGQQLVPQGSAYDPAALKRKAAEAAARISSEGKLPGTINLPGPDEVKDLVPTSGGPMQTVGQTAKTIGEDIIEAEYRNLPFSPSITDKIKAFGSKAPSAVKSAVQAATPVLKSGLAGAATSVLTGGLYDVDQEAKQEEISSGKKDVPVPGRSGFVFRGSEIVPEGSVSQVAPDFLPSLGDVLLGDVTKTGLGSLIFSKSQPGPFPTPQPGPRPSMEEPPTPPSKKEDEPPSKEKSIAAAVVAPLIAEGVKKILEPKNDVPLVGEGEEDKKQSDDFKKFLALANVAAGRERSGYSEQLDKALERRDLSRFMAQLGLATSEIGAGIGTAISKQAIKPISGDIYKSISESGEQRVTDILTKEKFEEEKRRKDPQSADSIAAREFFRSLNVDVPETASASFLEKVFPSVAALQAKREYAQAKVESDVEKAEKRDAELQQKKEERLKKEEDRKIESINKQANRFAARPEFAEQRSAFREVEEYENELSKVLNDSSFSLDAIAKDPTLAKKYAIPGISVPFLGRIDALSPEARRMRTAFDALLNRQIRAFAGKAVTKNELERIKSQYEGGKFANEADFLFAISKVKKATRDAIQADETTQQKEVLDELENRGVRIFKREQPSIPTQKTVSAQQLKKYVNNKDKNPHNKSEEEVASFLKNQGYSVEGY